MTRLHVTKDQRERLAQVRALTKAMEDSAGILGCFDWPAIVEEARKQGLDPLDDSAYRFFIGED